MHEEICKKAYAANNWINERNGTDKHSKSWLKINTCESWAKMVEEVNVKEASTSMHLCILSERNMILEIEQ